MDSKKAVIVYRAYTANTKKPKKTPLGLILYASSNCSIPPTEDGVIPTDLEFIGLPSKCILRVLPLLPTSVPRMTYRNTYILEHRHARILVTNTNEQSPIEIKKGDPVCHIILERNIDDVIQVIDECLCNEGLPEEPTSKTDTAATAASQQLLL